MSSSIPTNSNGADALSVLDSPSANQTIDSGIGSVSRSDGPAKWYEDNWITVWFNGRIDCRYGDRADINSVIKSLCLAKKQTRTSISQLGTELKRIRSQYTDHVRRRGSKFRGGGSLGRVIRDIQTYSRDQTRHSLAEAIRPMTLRQQHLERLVAAIDQHVTTFQVLLHNSKS